MDAETNTVQIASLAQSDALWALFVGSGLADQTNPALLQRAKRELKCGLKEGQGDVRQRRMRGASRIRGYLAEHE